MTGGLNLTLPDHQQDNRGQRIGGEIVAQDGCGLRCSITGESVGRALRPPPFASAFSRRPTLSGTSRPQRWLLRSLWQLGLAVPRT